MMPKTNMSETSTISYLELFNSTSYFSQILISTSLKLMTLIIELECIVNQNKRSNLGNSIDCRKTRMRRINVKSNVHHVNEEVGIQED